MCLTLHLDNKRFLCLFVKFVLYRGPVLCEKHRIPFFIPPPLSSIRLSISFSCVPCALKRFPRTSCSFWSMSCVERAFPRTPATNDQLFSHLLNFHMKDKPGGGGDAGGMDARVLVNGCQATA